MNYEEERARATERYNTMMSNLDKREREYSVKSGLYCGVKLSTVRRVAETGGNMLDTVFVRLFATAESNTQGINTIRGRSVIHDEHKNPLYVVVGVDSWNQDAFEVAKLRAELNRLRSETT